jgi:hypothetical protein
MHLCMAHTGETQSLDQAFPRKRRPTCFTAHRMQGGGIRRQGQTGYYQNHAPVVKAKIFFSLFMPSHVQHRSLRVSASEMANTVSIALGVSARGGGGSTFERHIHAAAVINVLLSSL